MKGDSFYESPIIDLFLCPSLQTYIANVENISILFETHQIPEFCLKPSCVIRRKDGVIFATSVLCGDLEQSTNL